MDRDYFIIMCTFWCAKIIKPSLGNSPCASVASTSSDRSGSHHHRNLW